MHLTAEDILKEKGRKLITVPPDSTIKDVLKIMTEINIGAMLVKDGDDILGIWTERDLTKNVLEDNFDIESARIKDYMTKNLVTAKHDESIYMLLDKFLGRRLRHLLIEKEGTFIGMLSTGDVIKSGLIIKDKELKDLNAFVSWEYYENWRYKPKS